MRNNKAKSKDIDVTLTVTISVNPENEALCGTSECGFAEMRDLERDAKNLGWYCNLFPGSKLREVKAGTKRCTDCLCQAPPTPKKKES